MLGRRRGLVVAAAAAAWTLVAPPAAEARRSRPRASLLTLDGITIAVRWIDGDTFEVLEGAGRGDRARVEGLNALESYGPVHVWGGWRPDELLAISKRATERAAAGSWTCATAGERDRYGRSLVRCPDLARALIGEGLAHVFVAERETADPALLAAQKAAQARNAGMWAKGVPARVVTSLHSADERRSGDLKGPYNRVCDTRTGAARVVPHERVLRSCERWCDGGSCMIYVPFERRYRGKPWCLRAPALGSRDHPTD